MKMVMYRTEGPLGGWNSQRNMPSRRLIRLLIHNVVTPMELWLGLRLSWFSWWITSALHSGYFPYFLSWKTCTMCIHCCFNGLCENWNYLYIAFWEIELHRPSILRNSPTPSLIRRTNNPWKHCLSKTVQRFRVIAIIFSTSDCHVGWCYPLFSGVLDL